MFNLILSPIVAALMLFTTTGNFMLDSLSEANELSKNTNKPVLLIFGSEQCIFCDKLKENILNNNLSESIDAYIVCYIDIDQNKEMSNEYNIQSIPDSRVLKNGLQKAKLIGFQLNNYKNWLNTWKTIQQ